MNEQPKPGSIAQRSEQSGELELTMSDLNTSHVSAIKKAMSETGMGSVKTESKE